MQQLACPVWPSLNTRERVTEYRITESMVDNDPCVHVYTFVHKKGLQRLVTWAFRIGSVPAQHLSLGVVIPLGVQRESALLDHGANFRRRKLIRKLDG